MSNLTELAKRLRLMAGWHEMAGFAERQADLLAAADALEAGEWRPISEAPKDGTPVFVGHIHRRQWSWKTTSFIDEAIEDGYTHWMPHPAPPEVKP